jgi:hypothetical protein
MLAFALLTLDRVPTAVVDRRKSMEHGCIDLPISKHHRQDKCDISMGLNSTGTRHPWCGDEKSEGHRRGVTPIRHVIVVIVAVCNEILAVTY